MNDLSKTRKARLASRLTALPVVALAIGVLQLPLHMPLADEAMSMQEEEMSMAEDGMAMTDTGMAMAAGLAQFAVERRVTLPVAADELWTVVGRFDRLHAWHPAISATDLSQGGRIRTVHLAGGGLIVESLEKSEEPFSYAYRILEGPLPVSDYLGVIRVTPAGDGAAELIWSSHFTAADREAATIIGGIYEQGFAALSARYSAE